MTVEDAIKNQKKHASWIGTRLYHREAMNNQIPALNDYIKGAACSKPEAHCVTKEEDSSSCRGNPYQPQPEAPTNVPVPESIPDDEESGVLKV